MGTPSPMMSSPINSNLEEIGNSSGPVKAYNVDTTTNQGDLPKISTLEYTTVIPPEVLNTESVTEEVKASGIPVNISIMDTNISMGDRVSNNESQLNQDQAQEHHIQDKLDQMDKCNELQIKAQSESFNGALTDLKVVARERHVLFIQDVKKLCEDVNQKTKELCEDMEKEVAALEHNYSSLHKKADIIVDVVTKYVTLYETILPKVAKKVDEYDKSYGNIDTLLVELKGLVLKSSFVLSLLINPELLSGKFKLLQSMIQKELATLAKIINMMPTDAPPVSTCVHGGEKGGVGIGSRVSARGITSNETDDDTKVVEKFFLLKFQLLFTSSSKPPPTTKET
ncbi:unnamed protein product [Lactuca saligna]|uniref:Uncharacterized protein n=1 Tax=Lactuca saligna TaxID=75948 RepID=A0AA35ZAW1_LACSI|nr:unnamed protein product [Lactuca saligna]